MILWEIFIDFLFLWIRSFHKICIAKELYFFILQLYYSYILQFINIFYTYF